MKTLNFRLISVAALLFVCILAYQNCTRVQIVQSSSGSHGNGDSYSGLTAHYLSQDTGNPCALLSNLGRPFPFREIFLVGGAYSLVRDNCQDITPVPLNPADISVNPTNLTITYQGKPFASQADLSEFNLVPITCPAGTAITGSNLFASPLDLTASVWQDHPEVLATLAESIQALPTYMIQMDTPGELNDWRRVSQNVPLQPNTSYVITFLLKAGNVSNALLSYNISSTELFTIIVDFNLQTATIQYNPGTTPTVTSIQPYGSGLAISVAFTSSADVSGLAGDIGIAPFRPNSNDLLNLGDFVYATSANLYKCQ